MVAGRPRTTSLSPEEMIELGKEMVQWVKDHQPLHVSEFYCIEKGYTDKEWRVMKQVPEFQTYYEQALKIVGKQYLDKHSNVRDNISPRWQGIYFDEMAEHEKRLVEHKIDYEIDKKAAADAKRGVAPQDKDLSTILQMVERDKQSQEMLKQAQEQIKRIQEELDDFKRKATSQSTACDQAI